MEKLQLNRQSFYWFARNMDDPAYPNDEALLKFLFGTPSAVATFVELIRWFRYSKRADGAVYKSDLQLAKAIGRSPKSIERARSILKDAGFTIFIKKANGVPTNHYLFDLERFLTFLADKLKIEIEKAREWLLAVRSAKMSKSEVASAQNDEMHSDSMSKSTPLIVEMNSTPNVEMDFDNLAVSSTQQIDTEQKQITEHIVDTTTTYQIPDVVVVDSDSLNMEIQSIASLLKIEEATISAWVLQHGLDRVKDVATRAVTSKKIGSPSGFAIKAIENNWQWAKSGQPVKPKKKYADYLDPY